jgi:hypothetical protein
MTKNRKTTTLGRVIMTCSIIGVASTSYCQAFQSVLTHRQRQVAAVSNRSPTTGMFPQSHNPKVVTRLPVSIVPDTDLSPQQQKENDDEENKTTKQQRQSLSSIEAAISKLGMILYIASMCVALPLTLFPLYILDQSKLVSQTQREQWALSIGQHCASGLLTVIPFCDLKVIPSSYEQQHPNDKPEPSIWVCNHTSSLDVFMLLASDLRLRGKNKRPLKCVYVSPLPYNTAFFYTMHITPANQPSFPFDPSISYHAMYS